MKKIKVLYIHHKGHFGGSSKSLLNMIQAFPPNSIDPYLICPGRGEVADIFEKNGIKVLRTVGISIFYHCLLLGYKGVRWLILLREIMYLLPTFFAILKAYKKWGPFDIVNINSIVMLWPALIIKLTKNTPIIMHARSCQENKVGKIRCIIREKIINYSVDQIIAIDNQVSLTLKNIKNVYIIHNGYQIKSTISNQLNRHKYINNGCEIPDNNIVVTIIGELRKPKGIFDFIEAARICLKTQSNITFLIVGKNSQLKKELYSVKGKALIKLGLIHDNEAKCRDIINTYGLEDNILFTGFVLDVSSIYTLSDILCFPNHGGAIGRPVFEAAMYRVPSVVYANPNNGIVLDNITGICVPVLDFNTLANQILKLVNNKKLRIELGENAKKHCGKIFDANQNSKKVFELYKDVILRNI